jgi:predicted RNase H-like nuclease (RuvC/YqgF family)
MLVGMGNNMMMCMACDHEFHETKVIEKEDTEMQELYQNVLRLEKRIDAQDKVIEALAKTVESMHEYTKIRDGHKGKS